MEPINIDQVQQVLDEFTNKDVYVHLETTAGAYSSLFNDRQHSVGAYIRNAKISFRQAKIIGNGSIYRVGLKMEHGWVYAEGLTDWTMYKENQLLLAGHDEMGRLMVALQISETPF